MLASFFSLSLHALALSAAYIVLTLARRFAVAKPRGSVQGKRSVGGGTPSRTLKDERLGGSESVMNKVREAGVWTPQPFRYPDVTPCDSALGNVKPVPYRPFKWGDYHVTMGIRAMPWSEWIELDSEFASYHRIRDFRVRTYGKGALQVLRARDDECVRVAGGADASKELVYELAEYLSRRYPASFKVTHLPPKSRMPTVGGLPLSWDGNMPVRTIQVIETGTEYDLGVLETLEGVQMGEEALRIVNGLTQDDFAIMMEGSDEMYYFQAGLICVPGFWRMRDKIGMPLDEIHLSGEVPQFKQKLQLSLNRFFKRLPLDKPVVRNNYSIQAIQPPTATLPSGVNYPGLDTEGPTASVVDPDELGWSESLNGPEDEFTHRRGHGTRDLPGLAPASLRLRTERQTLRRLPRTGALVFGIRTYQTSVADLVRERGVAARLASAVRSWPEDVASYKGRRRWQDVLLAYLDECAEREGVREPLESVLPYPY